MAHKIKKKSVVMFKMLLQTAYFYKLRLIFSVLAAAKKAYQLT